METQEDRHILSTASAMVQVIIAAMNEEEGIGLTIAELQEHLGYPNILVIDGRSTDRTVEVAKTLGAILFFKMVTAKVMPLRRLLILRI